MDAATVQKLRDKMPVCQNWAYFDHAAVAPLPLPAQAAITEWATDVANNGDANWSRWRKRVEEVRKLAAERIGAERSELAIIRNTTEGIGLIAEGLDWQPGDNVIVPTGEFPSNLLPWWNLQSRGVELRLLPTTNDQFELDELDQLIDDRTGLVSLSWVGFATGWRHDLQEIADLAHQRGSLLFVDAIQGLGVLELDLRNTPVDFLAADGHKWMLGPEGAGVLFIRNNRLNELRPLGLGWNSVNNAGNYDAPNFELRSSAARYEGGTYNMAGIHAFGASLEFLARFDISQISQRLADVTTQLCQHLEQAGFSIASSRTPTQTSGIVSVEVPGIDLKALVAKCKEAGVVVNARQGRLRLSPHIYTSEEDIACLVECLTKN
ncbi:MAG: aminotransferase [Planctomycetaceae bacterium]|nr:aminotransferase [Planctomycetaceae bacterium]